jgi:hypothetical protein
VLGSLGDNNDPGWIGFGVLVRALHVVESEHEDALNAAVQVAAMLRLQSAGGAATRPDRLVDGGMPDGGWNWTRWQSHSFVGCSRQSQQAQNASL